MANLSPDPVDDLGEHGGRRVVAWSSWVTVRRWARSRSASVSARNAVEVRLRSKAVRERRPASRTIQTCWERSDGELAGD